MKCLVKFYEAYLHLLTAVENLSDGIMPDNAQLVGLLSSLPFLKSEAERFKRQKGDMLPLYVPQMVTTPEDFPGVSKLDCHAYRKAWRVVAKAAERN